MEFPASAEKSSKMFSLSDKVSSRGLVDTGPTLRAFLPLSATQRTSLLSYNGKAALVESHVLCDIDNLTHVISSFTIQGNISTKYLEEAANELKDRGSFQVKRIKPSNVSLFEFNCSPPRVGQVVCFSVLYMAA